MNTIDKVAVCSRSFSAHPVLKKELKEKFKNVTFNETGISLKGNDLINFLEGHTLAITALESIDELLLSKLPDLKRIGKYGVGLDMIDISALEKYEVTLGYKKGVNKNAVAELTISFAILLLRECLQVNRKIKDGTFKQNRGRELGNVTFGILGCGNVGKRLVELLKPFKTKIIVNDIVDYKKFYRQHNITSLLLEDLLRESDILSIHVPLDDSTRNMLNEERLKLMKRGSFIINCARGNIVDEKVLLDLLNDNHISGAAFDVFSVEPPDNMSLINHKNFFCTSHIGGSTEESILAMGRAAISGLIGE